MHMRVRRRGVMRPGEAYVDVDVYVYPCVFVCFCPCMSPCLFQCV